MKQNNFLISKDGYYLLYKGFEAQQEMTVDEFKAWLCSFDADKDGRISREELQEALRSLHVWFGWWKVRRGMKAVDSDHTGHIDNAKEIEKLANYAQQQLSLKIYEKEDR